MIGIVDVEVQAANPQMPLCPFVAFVGSPSSVRVRNVPGNIGSWNITKVYVSANYPDNSIQSRECTRVGEIYVGTLPACNAVGKGANGFVVSADGVDESGNAVTGYVLGKGDLEILDADSAITPGVTTHYVHGLDEQPSDPHEYDIYKDGDTWKIYFDGAWGPLAPAPATLDDAVTRTSANGVKSSGIWSALWGALASLPTGFASLYDWCVAQLAGKASTADATLTDASAWACDPPNYNGNPITIVRSNNGFAPSINGVISGEPKGDETSTDLEWTSDWIGADDSITLTATRAALQGYQLGSQTTKPLASEAEAEALRTGKLDKSGGTVVGTLGVAGQEQPELLVFEVVPSADSSAPTMRFGDGAGAIGIRWRIAQTSDGHYNIIMEAGNELGESRQITLPFTAGTLALTAGTGHNGHLAALDANGNPTDSTIPAANVAVKGEIPYILVTKTIDNGAVSLDDRASNAVTVSATLSPNTLTINFPTALTGKLRDFSMRLNIAAGVTAPEIAWPQGVTLENNGGEVPEIADGGTGGSSTILYFSETENNGTTAKFLVKGETLTAIAQA